MGTHRLDYAVVEKKRENFEFLCSEAKIQGRGTVLSWSRAVVTEHLRQQSYGECIFCSGKKQEKKKTVRELYSSTGSSA